MMNVSAYIPRVNRSVKFFATKNILSFRSEDQTFTGFMPSLNNGIQTYLERNYSYSKWLKEVVYLKLNNKINMHV